VGYAPDGTTLGATVGDAPVPLKLGDDWRPFPFSDPGAIEGDVVFAGYGISSEEHGWDDYAGLDVEGKIVLILRHEPGEDDAGSVFDGKESSTHSTFINKAFKAAEHGAIGYLLVTDPRHHEAGDDFRVGGRLALKAPEPREAGESEGPEFRAAHISRAVAEKLVAGSGKSLLELQTAIDDGIKPAELGIGAVTASLAIKPTEGAVEVPEVNVVGRIEGSERPDEWVVVGAHYDHVGGYVGEGDTIYNGADDNASGTAGMLEIARAFATLPPPKRTIVFMAFSAEEKGLLGSRAWVEQNGVDKVVFMLNLDMIGRNPDKPVDLVGDGYGTGMTEIV
jgi:Zn-dependent M28 family amino/carboxypeptidase